MQRLADDHHPVSKDHCDCFWRIECCWSAEQRYPAIRGQHKSVSRSVPSLAAHIRASKTQVPVRTAHQDSNVDLPPLTHTRPCLSLRGQADRVQAA